MRTADFEFTIKFPTTTMARENLHSKGANRHAILHPLEMVGVDTVKFECLMLSRNWTFRRLKKLIQKEMQAAAKQGLEMDNVEARLVHFRGV